MGGNCAAPSLLQRARRAVYGGSGQTGGRSAAAEAYEFCAVD